MSDLPEATEFTTGWVFSGLRDSTSFFRHVHLLLPLGTALVLEEDSMAKDVRKFIDARATQPQVRVPFGISWPRKRIHWLDATPDNLKGLADLSQNHAEPELCSHLSAVADGRLILFWNDVFDDPLYVSSEIHPEAVAAFGLAVHVQPKPWQAA